MKELQKNSNKEDVRINVLLNLIGFLFGVISLVFPSLSYMIFVPFICAIGLFFYNLDLLHEIFKKESEIEDLRSKNEEERKHSSLEIN